MNGGKMLNGVQADPKNGALGDEIATNTHVPGSQPVCAGTRRIKPQCLLQTVKCNDSKPWLLRLSLQASQQWAEQLLQKESQCPDSWIALLTTNCHRVLIIAAATFTVTVL